MAAQAYKSNPHTVPALLRPAHPHERKTREERRGRARGRPAMRRSPTLIYIRILMIDKPLETAKLIANRFTFVF